MKPIMGTILKFKGQPLSKYICPACGAPTCDCGLPPVLRVAAKAATANPTKSSRAIAAEIGVSPRTVDTARKTGAQTNHAPEKRTGRDGKSYPATQPKSKAKAISGFSARSRSFA